MYGRSSLLAVLILVLIAVSCAPLGRRGAAPGAPDRIPVEVENQNFYEATIYAITNAARVRIGRVGGNASGVLSAPFPATGQLGFEIRLLAVGAYSTHSVAVVPGDTVHLVVPPDLHRRPGQPRQ